MFFSNILDDAETIFIYPANCQQSVFSNSPETYILDSDRPKDFERVILDDDDVFLLAKALKVVFRSENLMQLNKKNILLFCVLKGYLYSV